MLPAAHQQDGWFPRVQHKGQQEQVPRTAQHWHNASVLQVLCHRDAASAGGGTTQHAVSRHAARAEHQHQRATGIRRYSNFLSRSVQDNLSGEGGR